MDHELDRLLARLRQLERPESGLRDFDRLLDARLALHELRARVPRLALSFQAGAVALAFAVGLLVGVDVASARPAPPNFLVDVMDP